MSRPERFCIRGHDTHETGRYSNGMCSVCDRLRYEAKKSGRKLAEPRRYLPVEPLLAVLPSAPEYTGHSRRLRWDEPSPHFDEGYMAMGGIKSALTESQQRAVYRIRKDGRVTLDMADKLCIALGYHPAEVYGDLWWDEETG